MRIDYKQEAWYIAMGLVGVVMILAFTLSEMGKEKPLQGFEPKSDII